jgi:hypothetical protein
MAVDYDKKIEKQLKKEAKARKELNDNMLLKITTDASTLYLSTFIELGIPWNDATDTESQKMQKEVHDLIQNHVKKIHSIVEDPKSMVNVYKDMLHQLRLGNLTPLNFVKMKSKMNILHKEQYTIAEGRETTLGNKVVSIGDGKAMLIDRIVRFRKLKMT